MQTTIAYIEKYFDFSNENVFKKLQIFNLDNVFAFESLLDVIAALPIELNEDMLYEEFKILQKYFDGLVISSENDSTSD